MRAAIKEDTDKHSKDLNIFNQVKVIEHGKPDMDLLARKLLNLHLK